MSQARPGERAIYIPKGRRDQLESKILNELINSKKRIPSPTMDKNFSNKVSKTNEDQSTSDHNSEANSISSSKSTTVQKLSTSNTRNPGIYVPRGRRELNEQKTIDAPSTLKPKEDNVQNKQPKSVFRGDATKPISTSSSATEQEKSTQSLVTSVNNIDLDNNHTNTTNNTSKEEISKPKEIPRGIYIPKGRRELNEKKEQEPPQLPVETTNKTTSNHTTPLDDNNINQKETIKEFKAINLPPSSSAAVNKPKLTPYTKWDDSSEEEQEEEEYIAPLTQEEIILNSCLLLTGVPNEMSEIARSNIVRNYQDKGATVRWYSATECILVFKNERAAVGSIPSAGASIFRVIRLKDVPVTTARADMISCKLLYSTVVYKLYHYIIQYISSSHFYDYIDLYVIHI